MHPPGKFPCTSAELHKKMTMKGTAVVSAFYAQKVVELLITPFYSRSSFCQITTVYFNQVTDLAFQYQHLFQPLFASFRFLFCSQKKNTFMELLES